jgi:hypothetical protein
MPAQVEQCVRALTKKWKSDPDSKPDSDKPNDELAWSICQAGQKKLSEEFSEDEAIMLAGKGPTVAGVGLTNRPYIKGLPPAQVVVDGNKELIKVPFLKFGNYRHPRGPRGKLVFTPEFLARLQDNFRENTYGQKILLDRAHKPDDGNQGELVKIESEGDYGVGYFDPTEAGLDTVKKKELLYGSMDFYMNYEGNEISMSMSEDGFGEVVLEDTVELLDPNHDEESADNVDKKGAEALSDDSGEALNGAGKSSDETKQEDKMSDELNEQALETDAGQVMLSQEEYDRFKSDQDTLSALMESNRATLSELNRQKHVLYTRDVDTFLDKASIPFEGRGYDKPVLDVIRSLLLGGETGEDDSIKLSEGDDESVAAVHDYYRAGVRYLLSVIPRSVKAGTDIEQRDVRPEDDTVALSEQLKADRRMAAELLGVTLDEED